MKMKKQLLLAAVLTLLAAGSARATLYTFFNSGTMSGVIPDGNPVGAVFSGTVSGHPANWTVNYGLTVTLDISGGYAGNLYSYLVAPNGTMVVLLNEPGTTGAGSSPFGNPASSIDITLQVGAAPITASSSLTGGNTYSAYGSLAGFNGSPMDGTWHLFFADEVSGGGTSTLTGWSLSSVVPEPVNVALPIFAAGMIGIGAVRSYRGAKKADCQS